MFETFYLLKFGQLGFVRFLKKARHFLMAGFFVQCAKQKQTILLDGMIATAGALVAQQFYPEVADQMIAAHESEESAHAPMLDKLTLTPMLKWKMRLGEGTGALALYPLLAGAAAWVTQMAKIDDIKLA